MYSREFATQCPDKLSVAPVFPQSCTTVGAILRKIREEYLIHIRSLQLEEYLLHLPVALYNDLRYGPCIIIDPYLLQYLVDLFLAYPFV